MTSLKPPALLSIALLVASCQGPDNCADCCDGCMVASDAPFQLPGELDRHRGSLVSYHPLDDTAGARVVGWGPYDADGESYRVRRVQGVQGGAFGFTSSAARVNIPFPYIGLPVADIPALTVQMWVRPDTIREDKPQFLFGNRDRLELSVELHGRRAVLLWDDIEVVSTHPSLVAGRWTLLTFVAQSSRSMAYLDGVLDSTVREEMPTRFNTGYYSLGSRNVDWGWEDPFRGTLDELFLFSSALDSGSIRAYHLASRP